MDHGQSQTFLKLRVENDNDLCVQVYDWIAGSKLVVPPSHFMSRAEALYNFPKLREEVCTVHTHISSACGAFIVLPIFLEGRRKTIPNT